MKHYLFLKITGRFKLDFGVKIWKKVILKQLDQHLSASELMDALQSAYREKHPAETALLKVQNDMLSSLDGEGSVVVLLMLDSSAEFDRIDHALFISRLGDMYGIHDQALVWIKSYLSDRLQRVNIN